MGASINRFEQPTEFGRSWCWIFWHLDVPVASLARAAEICFRAWDDSQNCMPSMPTWNLMGMMNNPWFRVKVHRVPGTADQIWFEHPTRVEETLATFYSNGETMHLINGEVASPGWAERMHADYSAAYLPKEKNDEQPDPQSGWEGEVAYRLGAQILLKGGKEVQKFNIAGKPLTLQGKEKGKEIKLKLAERRQLSRSVVHYSFALPSVDHVLGLPIGQHVYLSTEMANPRTGGESKYTARAYTPISTDTQVGKVDLVIKTYYKDEHPKFPDGGWLSQYMDSMKVGDELDFRGPTGAIIYEGKGVFNIRGEKRSYREIGCLAGGNDKEY